MADNLVPCCKIVLQDLLDPFSIATAEYQIVWGNRKKAVEHGLSQKELTGKICYKLFFKRNYPCPKCAVINVIESKKAHCLK